MTKASRVRWCLKMEFIPKTFLYYMSQTRDDLGNSWRIRSITGWMLVTGLIIDNAYGGGLASSFTVPKYEASIDTVQDIVDRKMEWGATHDAWIFSIILSEEVSTFLICLQLSLVTLVLLSSAYIFNQALKHFKSDTMLSIRCAGTVITNNNQ